MAPDTLQSWLAHAARERSLALARACEAPGWIEAPEGLRRVRLAARRLRSVLEELEDPPPGARREARRWTRELGRLRSLDVASGLLSEAGERVGSLATQAAAEHLLEALDHRRRQASKHLAQRLGERLDLGAPGPRPDPPPARRLWQELTPRVREALEPLRAAAEDRNAEALHRQRLATKRLRYALEVLGPAFASAPDQVLLALKALQDALGRAHDWTELEGRIAACLQALEARHRAVLASGLEPLRAEARRQRDLSLDQVAALAAELDPLAFATLLRRTLGGTA